MTMLRRESLPVPVRLRAVRVLSVRWRVARRALRELPDAGAWGERGPALTLEVSCAFSPGGQCQRSEARLIDGEREWPLTHTLARAPKRGALVMDPARGLEHADVPGVLTATYRVLRSTGIDVLYSRTPLLDALSIPGGCAEPCGGSIGFLAGDA